MLLLHIGVYLLSKSLVILFDGLPLYCYYAFRKVHKPYVYCLMNYHKVFSPPWNYHLSQENLKVSWIVKAELGEDLRKESLTWGFLFDLQKTLFPFLNVLLICHAIAKECCIFFLLHHKWIPIINCVFDVGIWLDRTNRKWQVIEQ